MCNGYAPFLEHLNNFALFIPIFLSLYYTVQYMGTTSKKFLQIVFVIYSISIMVLSFYPLKELPLPSSDKTHHFLAFLVFAILEGVAFQSRFRMIFFSAFVFGAFIEFVQSFLPYRSAELADLGADLLGTVVGIIILRLAVKF